MNRGDRREDIVHRDENRELFVKPLGQACAKCFWQVHARCLMSNYFHSVVETQAAFGIRSVCSWLRFVPIINAHRYA
jgi:hypothetical protein